MNKILTTSISDPSIGQPLTGKSLEFLQNANKESIAGLCEAMIGYNYSTSVYYVISGLYPYGTNQFKEGYVYYNGELFYSAGKVTTTAFSNIPVLTLTITNDATADPLTFTDNVSRNVHNVRRMVLSDAVSGTGTVDLANCVYVYTKWNYVGAGGFVSPFLSMPSFQNSWANEPSGIYFNLAFKKDSQGFVSLRGRIDSGSSGTTVFTLPAGYRPTFAHVQNIYASDLTHVASLTVTSGGAVGVSYSAGTTSVFLDGVRFSTSDY